MAHAIEMFLDDHAEAAVHQLWEILDDHGLPSLATLTHRRHRPHVSLTVAESLTGTDLGDLRSVLAESRPTLKLSSLGLFPGAEGVLFLGATVTHELLTFHNRVHAALANQSIKHWPCYLPGNWVPHCTLAVGLKREEVVRATEVLHDFAPIVAVVSAIGSTDTTTGEITSFASGSIG